MLPNTPFDVDLPYRIQSEFGPQSLRVAATLRLNVVLRSMQASWGALALSIHPRLEIEVQLSMFDAVK